MSIKIIPESTTVEIAQNVNTILGTTRGTCPLNRGLGIDAAIVDMPAARGMALLSADIIDALPQQEPRINIKKVAFSGDAIDGKFLPKVEYEVIE